METIFDFDPRALPKRLLSAIGLAITSFAQTEQFMEDAIAGCCGIDIEYGKAVTVHMSMPLRFSVLRSVGEIRIDSLDVLDELDRHLDLIDECIKKRNYMAHRRWCRHPETGAIYTIKADARSRPEVGQLAISIDQVEKDAQFIYQTGIDFFVFLHRHYLNPALPPKRRERSHKSKMARKKRSQKG